MMYEDDDPHLHLHQDHCIAIEAVISGEFLATSAAVCFWELMMAIIVVEKLLVTSADIFPMWRCGWSGGQEYSPL